VNDIEDDIRSDVENEYQDADFDDGDIDNDNEDEQAGPLTPDFSFEIHQRTDS